MLEKLFALGKPCSYTVEMEVSPFQDLAFQLTENHQKSVIRMIRGGKCKNLDSFFNEIAAALQFPYYFGENWAAFFECITDLEWLEGDSYLLMINDAQAFLQDSEADFHILLRHFEEANTEWQKPPKRVLQPVPPTPFHVLFQCTTEQSMSFRQRLQDAQIQFEQLKL